MNRSERQFGPEFEPDFDQSSPGQRCPKVIFRDTESIFVNIHYNFIAQEFTTVKINKYQYRSTRLSCLVSIPVF